MKKVNDILDPIKAHYSPKEVAGLLRATDPSLNDSTVLRWCQKGRIEAGKPFGRWYITRQAVVKLLVAFGVAAAAFFHGNHAHAGYMFNTRKAYHQEMHEQGIQENWTTNRS